MADLLSLLTLAVCFIAVLVLLKCFGGSGLLVYAAVAVVVSNLQVLKLTQYAFTEHPVALGTVVFSTIFAVDNILTEYFGKETAKKCVWLSFCAYLFFAVTMKIAVCHPPMPHSECLNLHREMESLFSPSLTILTSSLISYVLSQLIDIFVFSKLKKLTKGKYLSCRSLISMMISAFADNLIFSALAWVVFAECPVSWAVLWKTYICVTYLLRLFIAALCVPLVRIAGILMPRRLDV
ncbi:MAG: queuosine precursor transporter [Holosporaceae bacterium]|jgi:uncharacterized integral membrane protein (TIGR00697 family)|nr:queuosine precursor transporter [Holosporaceae bacterium]